MQRFRNPFILGAFTGCLLTTIIYVTFSGVLWSARSTGNFFVRQLEDHRPDILKVQLGVRNSPRDPVGQGQEEEDDVSILYENSVYGKQVGRKVLLGVIAAPRDTVETVLNNINSTWGEANPSWKIAMGAQSMDGEVQMSASRHVFPVPDCHDFSPSTSAEYMSPGQLFCLLETVHNLYRFQYQWFLIGVDSTYLSMSRLERLLETLGSHDSIVYMGKQHASNGHCVGESGIILSQAALRHIVPHLQLCLEVESFRANASTGDATLGACFESKLQKTCQEPAGLFVSEFEGMSRDSYSKWMSDHRGFVTVTPVRTSYAMQVLYVADQLLELEYFQNEARDSAERLYNSSVCQLHPLKVDLSPPQASTEVRGWSVANPNSTYFSNRLEPREWYDGDLRLELETIARDGLEETNRRSSTNLQFRRVLYGVFRYDFVNGREIILDVETVPKEIKRMHIFRPHLLEPILLEDAGPEAIHKTIDFVVPLSNVSNRFAEFMKNYEDLCLKVDEKCRLNLVVYGAKDFDVIRSNLTYYKTKYPSAQLNIIPGEGEFSRGRALHAGISKLHKSDLAFLCDVDMTVERDFLNRCRRNAIQGRRVYSPEVFKYYDMDYVYKFEPKPLFGYDISRKHGHWCTYGYGMLCIYKSDYDMVGGFDTTIEGWGGEDVQLMDNVIKYRFEVMRAPDPSLSHRHHPKVCSKKLSRIQFTQCVQSRNEDIADRRRLSDYIYYLENKCNLKKKMWD